MPKRASRHQAMRASRCAGVSVSWIAAHGMSGRNGDVLALDLGEGGQRDTRRGAWRR